MTLAASASAKAFRVSARTFPWLPMARRTCITASSLGTSVTATKSYWPCFYMVTVARREEAKGL